MKKLFLFAAVLLMAASFNACTEKPEIDDPNGDTQKYNVVRTLFLPRDVGGRMYAEPYRDSIANVMETYEPRIDTMYLVQAPSDGWNDLNVNSLTGISMVFDRLYKLVNIAPNRFRGEGELKNFKREHMVDSMYEWFTGMGWIIPNTENQR